jgi:hypothetical protein
VIRHRHLGDQFQVLRIGRDDDVDVLGGAHDSPGAKGQTADHDELRAGVTEALQQLVECGHAQLRFAASAILISSWLSAIVSAKFTLSDRRASSRRRRTRTASAALAECDFSFAATIHIVRPGQITQRYLSALPFAERYQARQVLPRAL